ncbi:hypothetical protein B0T10DRAFT_467187 [Thelonectria olida]|uniref:Uncharacterized protein n=1 Tax=Thelonectria olida TaxID=1576542 RepID=A0A9P8VSC4_9HYPO|nr:hypothetical protein B0T10DRAFT_467187 [Thelonectria olida]
MFLIQSTGHDLRAQDSAHHQQSHRGEHCRETGWGSEFYSNRTDPGTPTEKNSPTSYEIFASAPQRELLQDPGNGTIPTRKPRRRHNARKSIQPARGLRRSERIQKKQRSKRDGNMSRTTLGPPATLETDAIRDFQEQLRLLEEQNRKRLEAN